MSRISTFYQCASDGNIDEAEVLLRHFGAAALNERDGLGRMPIHYAVKNNHLDFVKFLIKHGADVNAKTKQDDSSPLHYACTFKDKKSKAHAGAAENPFAAFMMKQQGKQAPVKETMVSFLLSCPGIKADQRNKYGQTPLHLTAIYEKDDACKALIRHGVNIEAGDQQDMTALHLAAARKDKAVAETLIQEGAELLCQDQNGSTPLHMAAEEGNSDIARALLERAVNREVRIEMLTVKDRMGNTCLHSAVLNNRSACVVEFLQRGGDLSSPNKMGRTPLHLAAMIGDSNIIERIREEAKMDLNINAQDCNKDTPLHKAAAFRDGRALVALLDPNIRAGVELDIDVNIRNDRECTPFLVAAKRGRVQSIVKLKDLSDKVQWDAVDVEKKTALCLAAEANHSAAVEVMLENSRMMDLMEDGDMNRMNPLLIASKNGHLDVLKVLMSKNADLGAKNNRGMSALHLAAKHGHIEIVHVVRKHLPMLLFDKDDKINTALHLAAKAGHIKVVEYLIQQNTDLSAKNDKALTPFAAAVMKGWLKCTEKLLDAGSDISATDKDNNTSLHVACMKGHQTIVELLIKRGASMSAINLDGKNCLDLAIDFRQPHVVETILSKEYSEKVPTEWRDALRKRNGYDTPMRKLVREMPEKAEIVLTKCMTMVENKVTFDYEFVDDMETMRGWVSVDKTNRSHDTSVKHEDQAMDAGEFKRNHVMMVMLKSERMQLISHPLVCALLRRKWMGSGNNKFSSRNLFYLTFFIYVLFLSFFTGYMVALKAPYEENDQGQLDNFAGSDVCEKLDSSKHTVSPAILGAKYLIIIFAAILLIIEIIQFFQARLNYLTFENLLEWVILVFAILAVIDVKQCQVDTGYRLSWQWALGAVALFLVWVNLVLYFQRLPKFGIYIVMFKDIFSTFLEFFLVYILLIIAFALGFYSLMRNTPPFSTFGYAFVKTAVMMTGEFEFGDVFLEATLFHEVVSYILFVGLTITLSIIVMNLLVGLAVDNIKEIQEKAALTRQKMQVDLVLEIESIMPKKQAPKLDRMWKKGKKMNPGVEASNIETLDLTVEYRLPFKLHRKFGLESYGITAEAVKKSLQPEKTEMKQLHDDTFQLQLQGEKMRQRVKGLQAQMNDMMKMMTATMQTLNVQIDKDETTAYETAMQK